MEPREMDKFMVTVVRFTAILPARIFFRYIILSVNTTEETIHFYNKHGKYLGYFIQRYEFYDVCVNQQDANNDKKSTLHA